MKRLLSKVSKFQHLSKHGLALVLCGMLPLTGFGLPGVQENTPSAQAQPIPSDQLQALVAPIALYPDELLSQILVASTYPLEIVQFEQWMQKNQNLKEEELVEAVKKQKWDPSIQALVTFPDLVERFSGNIQWTTDLGNAFLAQQSDVMDAIQSMRKQATDSGKLQSTEQQKVETRVVQDKTVVVIEPSSPEVVYVPSYNPAAVWGTVAYPYPPVSYPPAGYVATGLLSFGAGVAVGSIWGGHGYGWGGWGWGCGWGDNDIEINRDFVRNNNLNVSRSDIASARGTSVWQHNSVHRGGTPYPNRQTANRFGGTARGESLASRRQANPDWQRGDVARERQQYQRGDRSLARADYGGAGDRIGNRDIQRSPGQDRDAFSGIDRGGGFARSSSARGHSSLGGGRRGGGGFGRRR